MCCFVSGQTGVLLGMGPAGTAETWGKGTLFPSPWHGSMEGGLPHCTGLSYIPEGRASIAIVASGNWLELQPIH